jgi:hypothetical protein
VTAPIEQRHRARAWNHAALGLDWEAPQTPRFIKHWVETGEWSEVAGVAGELYGSEHDRLARAFAELEADVRAPYEAEKAEEHANWLALREAEDAADKAREERRAARREDENAWEFTD